MSFSWKKLLPLVLFGGALVGCGGGRYYSRDYPPAYRSVGPRSGYVYVDPYYQNRRGIRYGAVPGRWVRPPQSRSVWVPGHWATDGRNQIWVRGGWR